MSGYSIIKKRVFQVWVAYVFFGLALTFAMIAMEDYDNNSQNSNQVEPVYVNRQLLSKTDPVENRSCTKKSDCNNGKCEQDEDFPDDPTKRVCVCDKGYIDYKGVICDYKQRPQLNAFLASFLGGGLGAEWYYLARGNGLYIFAGVMKLLTAGGCGIWWIIDWCRVLANAFPDGNGVELKEW